MILSKCTTDTLMRMKNWEEPGDLANHIMKALGSVCVAQPVSGFHGLHYSISYPAAAVYSAIYY